MKQGDHGETDEPEQFRVISGTLLPALSSMYGRSVLRADCRTDRLHGGTLGDVRLVTGTAETADGEKLPYKIVLKTQKKWERPGDPDSWRREYDLYVSDFGKILTGPLHGPELYHAGISGDEVRLWMEYITGLSGSSLGIGDLEHAACELGRFQGRYYGHPEIFGKTKYLSRLDTLEKNFGQWHTQTYSYEFLVSEKSRLPEFMKKMLLNGEIKLCRGKSFEYGCLRSGGCGLPLHLKKMIADTDGHREEIFASFRILPAVFCHRDFWTENIFLSDGKIRLIDWDCAGIGYAGEDIASLAFDEIGTEDLLIYFRRLTAAYTGTLSEYMPLPPRFGRFISKMILILFGYRTVRSYMFAGSPEEKEETVRRLQMICEMQDMTDI